MTPARFSALERDLTPMERRVFDAVPIAEAWTASAVVAELGRGSHRVEHRVVLGVLGALRERGLVREGPVGMYVRVQARQAVALQASAPAPTADNVVPIATAAAIAPPSTLVKIAELSSSLRGSAKHLTELATQLDDIALEVEDTLAKVSADSLKLRQPQELLRSIGGAA